MRFLLVLLLLSSFAVSSGCTSIYKASVDERNVKTIASDATIKAKIIKAYIKNKEIKTLDIFVASYRGHVYLVGEYRNEGQKKKAIRIAKRMENVKDVSTYFLRKDRRHPCGKKKNLKITIGIKAELAKDSGIWSTNVDVKTIQCTAVLVGLVGDKREIEKSIAHAKAYKGVRNVKSFLRAKRQR